MSADPATLAWYEANAGRYAGSTNKPTRYLDAFLDRLNPHARVLELGCGAGQDAARMAARGFTVDPTDATAAQIAQAKGLFGLPARQMRFDELAACEAYDAVWANACLIHVARGDFTDVLVRIHRALRCGGWHFASFKLGDAEGRDGFGRLHNFPASEWLVSAYEAAGFAIEDYEVFRGNGADGVVRDWLAITVRRPF